MNIEKPPAVDRLEVKHRNFLQVALIKKVVAENPTTEQRNKWITQNAERISDIIDGNSEKSQEIRELARQEKYQEAAELLKELI